MRVDILLYGMLVYIALITVTCQLSSGAASDISREDFVSLVEQCDAQISNLSFDVVREETWLTWKRGKPEPSAETVQPNVISIRAVLEGPARGKVRVEFDGDLPWAKDGVHVSPPSPTKEWRAFNSKVETSIQFDTVSPGRKDMPITQSIWGQRQIDTDALLGMSGVDLIPKYFKQTGLAECLRRSSDWTIERNDVGYTIRIPGEKGSPEDGGYWRIGFDPTYGTAVTGLEFCLDDGPVLFGYKNVTLQEVDGVWLPASCDYFTVRSNAHLTFRSVKINQTLDEGVFVLDFYPGYPVGDNVNDVIFTPGPISDRALLAEMTEDLEKAAELAEDGARGPSETSAGTVTVGTDKPSQVPEKTTPKKLYWVLWGLLLLLVLLLLLFVLKGIRARRMPTLMLLAGCVAAFLHTIGPLRADVDPEPFYEVIVGGKKVPVFQCGLYAALAVLKSQNIDCNVDALRECLKCTREGTDMLTMKKALMAYGLVAEGVEHLDASYLHSHIENGGRAIVWSSTRAGNTFTAVVGHVADKFVSLRYPKGAVVLDTKHLSSELAKGEGKALLVSAGRKEPSADPIEVSPVEIDIGEINPRGDKITSRFSVRNTSSSGALIEAVRNWTISLRHRVRLSFSMRTSVVTETLPAK